MPPKVKVTKHEIVETAVELVRIGGEQAINARTLANALHCSTQPIFSNFESMDQLRLTVVARTDEICTQYIQNEMDRGEYPPYKAHGMAYIRFAREEPELFKLLYMRDRTTETVSEEQEFTHQITDIICQNTGLDLAGAKLFHLEMWAYVHGIATMFATGFLDLPWDLVSQMLTDSYQGLIKRHTKE